MTAPPNSRRLPQLDAVRGIAALVVVFNHYAQLVPEQVRLLAAFPGAALNPHAWATPWPWLRFTPLRTFLNGEAAVDIFFVLSGFVLALTLTKQQQPSYLPFVVKRLCRVYIPFFVVTLAIALLYALVPISQNSEYSHWLNAEMPPGDAYAPPSLVNHILMVGETRDDTILNPVMWTLIHEVRISFFLPVIFFFFRRFSPLKTMAVCLLLSAAASLGMTSSVSGSWQATAHFLWMFAAGSAISFHRNDITRILSMASRKQVLFMWAAAIMLLNCQFDFVWSNFLIGPGAALLIILCLSPGRMLPILVSPVPIWLGRVSYSLYLMHFPIMLVAACGRIMPPIGSFLLTLVLAELAYRFIEAPAHRLGVWLTEKMKLQVKVNALEPGPVGLKSGPPN